MCVAMATRYIASQPHNSNNKLNAERNESERRIKVLNQQLFSFAYNGVFFMIQNFCVRLFGGRPDQPRTYRRE